MFRKSFFVVICLSVIAAFPGTGSHKNNIAKNGCTGWNCGIAEDANAQAWWQFNNGALIVDSLGNYGLTAGGSPSADTSNYIQGDACVLLESSSSDRYSRTGTTSDFGWASSNALSITFWFRATTSTENYVPFFLKGVLATNRAICIEHLSGNTIRLRVDGNDDGTYENYSTTQTFTDGQWYFVAVTINASTNAYVLYVWDQTAQSVLETVSGTLSNGIANLDAAGNIYIGNNSGTTYFDGRIDEMTVWNKVLTSEEIASVRQGTYQ